LFPEKEKQAIGFSYYILVSLWVCIPRLSLGTRKVNSRLDPSFSSKREIILKGVSLGVDYAETHSCYNPDKAGRACGKCDSCRLRLKGFYEAGIIDTAPYQSD